MASFSCLAGLEGGNLGSSDGDGLLGAGIQAGTLGAVLHLERAKAHQLHLLLGLQTLGDGGQSGVDSSLGSLLGQTGLLGDGIDQFGFIHG